MLDDATIVACRWEYEHTPASLRQLWDKYGWDNRVWAREHGWKKVDTFPDYSGPEGEERYKRDVEAAVRAAYNEKMVFALEKQLASERMRAASATKVNLSKEAKEKFKRIAPIPVRSETRPFGLKKKVKPKKAAKAKPPPEAPEAPKTTIVAFPGTYSPPPLRESAEKPFRGLPQRSKEDVLETKVRLAALKGDITLQQFDALQRHDDVLADYRHLLACYLSPQRFVKIEGLSDEDAADRLKQIQTAALRLLLPSERDTLAGAILALNKAQLASIVATRQVLGMERPRGGRGGVTPDPDADNAEAAAAGGDRSADQLGVKELREVKRGMELLMGVREVNREPPMPPPPDSLDDLVEGRSEDPPIPPEPPPPDLA